MSANSGWVLCGKSRDFRQLTLTGDVFARGYFQLSTRNCSIEKCWPKRLFFGRSGYQVLNCALRRQRRSLLSVTGGRYAIEFFEVACEVAAVADAYLIHRFLYPEVSSLQQYARMLHPGAGQVLAQRLPGVVFEEMAQTGRREVYQVGQSFGVQVSIKLSLN